MTSPENLNQDQFKDHIQVYRGLRDVAPSDVRLDSLGQHWTSSRKVAESFADDVSDPANPGTVVGGLVHPNHIVRENDPDYGEVLALGYEPDSPEAELPVRKGSPVQVTSLNGRWEDREEDTYPQKEGRA